jgi:beta-alanine--pyruvate transaminase
MSVAHEPQGNPNDLGPFWMPFTPNKSFKENPRIVSKAEGMHYYTTDGRKVLDAAAGLWCCNAGHGREAIVKAIQAQTAEMDFSPTFQFSHPKAFEAASRIAALAPGDLDHVFFTNSGSEAADTALKIAIAYHRYNGEGSRTRLIGRVNGYHGVGFGGISVGGMSGNRKLYGPLLSGTDHLPETYNREHQAFTKGEPEWGAHLADELEALVRLHDASTIAAVIVEPVAGSGGVVPPPQGYLQRLREICDRHGILLIFDEVICGFGRLGHAFAAERYGVTPDLLTFAKGVTSGTVPMGGVIARKHVHDVVEGEGQDRGPHEIRLYHGYTYSAHPLACAAAIAAQDVYRDEGLFQRAKNLEPLFADAIMSLKEKVPVDDIRTVGLAAGFDVRPDPSAPGRHGYEVMSYLFNDLDMMVRLSGDTVCLSPALIVSEDEIGTIIDKMGKAIQHVAG